MDLSGYKLEPLHGDGELILYRGAHPRPADGTPSSVLVVGPAGEYASPATLARLEHEYSPAGELDPRGPVGQSPLCGSTVTRCSCSTIRAASHSIGATVKEQRGRVMAKMQAGSVADLVRLASRLGITPAGAGQLRA
jgi:hypothetical protein